MPRALSAKELAEAATPPVIIDVRKQPAKIASGLTMPGALLRDPADIDAWREEFRSRSVVVFCVHGHEVSQGVAVALAEIGADAAFLEGGFEAWRDAGGGTAPMGEVA